MTSILIKSPWGNIPVVVYTRKPVTKVPAAGNDNSSDHKKTMHSLLKIIHELLEIRGYERNAVAALALNVLYEQNKEERLELYGMFETLVDNMVDPRRQAYMIYKSEEMEQWITPTD